MMENHTPYKKKPKESHFSFGFSYVYRYTISYVPLQNAVHKALPNKPFLQVLSIFSLLFELFLGAIKVAIMPMNPYIIKAVT